MDEGSRGTMSDEDGYVDVESDAERRAHHNALERRRRDGIKENFNALRNAVPSLQGVRASRAQILHQTAAYIANTRRKNAEYQADLDAVQRESKYIEKQIRLLKKKNKMAGAAGDGYPSTSAGETGTEDFSAIEGGSGAEASVYNPGGAEASGYYIPADAESSGYVYKPGGASGKLEIKSEPADA
ncbi:protein max-like isoform X3 [Haemaphysalis longicornis]